MHEKTMNRPDPELIERLRGFTTGELCDGAGFAHAMDYQIKPGFGRPHIVGPALTVDLPAGESAMAMEAILMAQPGDVLVLSAKGHCKCACWGDYRSLAAKLQGAEGVVIDGAYRDLEGCEEAGFPIFARALTCVGAGKSPVGSINVPVSCGGVTVNPGDLIIGDVNGVMVLRPEEAEAAMEKAEKKRAKEEEQIAEMLRTGKAVRKAITK